jgi:hypothetical protein
MKLSMEIIKKINMNNKVQPEKGLKIRLFRKSKILKKLKPHNLPSYIVTYF